MFDRKLLFKEHTSKTVSSSMSCLGQISQVKHVFGKGILVTGRHGGLMVSALIPGVSGPGSSPGRGHCVVFLTLIVPLSTQEYKWVQANCWKPNKLQEIDL